MDILKQMRAAGCKLLKWHKWPKEAEGTVFYQAKAGLFVATITTGSQKCAFCAAQREVFKMSRGIFMHSGWEPMTPLVRQAIAEECVRVEPKSKKPELG